MEKREFQLQSAYQPAGDQPAAIEKLVANLKEDRKWQTLLGVTGSGKTFTMANVIQKVQKPTLVLVHNKTLAAQLFAEFKEFFPNNAVSYFVSYYDYYQPEAYVPSRDLFIDKETDINEDIERYRNAATQAALSRNDVIIIASVSCIYGLGSPEDYTALARTLKVGERYPREKLLNHLADMQYVRSEYDFFPGMFRVRGDNLDINLVASDTALRVEYFGDEIEALKLINPVSGEVLDRPAEYTVYPAKQYVTPFERVKSILPKIREDLAAQKAEFLKQGKILEATRLEQRVNYDLEMLEETGHCLGIENYSRYFDGRPPGSPPSTLLDYLSEDWLLIVDESHITLPQVRGMYNGDRARKETLVQYGFRLEAALDNRPLKFNEFTGKLNQTICVSATPSEYELQLSEGAIAEQIIRPTGLLDPLIYLRPSIPNLKEKLAASLAEHGLTDELKALQEHEVSAQIEDLLVEIKATIAQGQRVLVTTLTKRMSEDLSSYLEELGIKVQYLHSDIDAIERVEILNSLRRGTVDVVVGINLLREGLDLPEVSLVAILDADKEGFLRSHTSFVQTIGRAARHSQGRVILYADKVTGSMLSAIQETKRRRAIQEAYNTEHGITPTTIISSIKTQLQRTEKEEEPTDKERRQSDALHKRMESFTTFKPKERKQLLGDIRIQMEIYADSLEFEKAAELRDWLTSHT